MKYKKNILELTTTNFQFLVQEFSEVVFLNSNSKTKKSYLALGNIAELKVKDNDSFGSLKNFLDTHQNWAFGHLNYDLKNEIESTLSSKNEDRMNFPIISFFVPKYVIEITQKEYVLHYHKKEDLVDFMSFYGKKSKKTVENNKKRIVLQKMKKEEYLRKFKLIKENIQQGNCYEMNFCHEFYVENTKINPWELYLELNKITNAPFSCFYKKNEKYILSASPERFLKKQGNKITSQPIKGTAKRGKTKQEDLKIKLELENNLKERAENVMIVDLVRNDLSKTAKKASVKVEELCKVYSFDTVHQMTSTVTSQIRKDTHVVDVLKSTFPMGSMTGAPKIASMKLIEELETTKRGVYSGTIGYFKPNQDFDFNVVIRSLLYDKKSKNISFMVGGAITIKANAEQEYEETLLKAKALLEVLKK